jgi:2-keto-4-pentenoate hydratase
MTSGLAKLLLAHRAARTTIDQLPAELVPQDMEAAYAIQTETMAVLGPVGAWKVSPYPETGEPLCSVLPASYLHQSGATLDRADLHDLGIEVEIALTLGQDLPGGTTPQEAQAAIGSVHLALELIASRFTDRTSIPRTAAFADLQNSGGIVLGAPVRFDALPELGGEAMTLVYDGEETASATGGPSTDNVLRSLAWLATHAASRGLELKQGTVVITGARIGPKPFAGRVVAARSDRFGTIEVDFEG